MGTAKKEKSRRSREGNTTDGNIRTKGENFYRSAKRVKQLSNFKGGEAQRNKEGKIVQSAAFQSRDRPTAVIEPNRKWFTNSRVISQESLTAFRNAMAEQKNDPYSVLLKRNKLPMSLIQDEPTANGLKQHRAKITLEATPFSAVFGDKSTRKRVKLSATSITDFVADSETGLKTYHERMEQSNLLKGLGEGGGDAEDASVPNTPFAAAKAEPVFAKGQSKRIWNELYRTIDSSDVILHVLDARDPLGTRCRAVEEYLRKEAPHKHLVFLLNKCDLVPSSVAAKWVRLLQKDAPCCAFRASITNPFGKGSVIALLRQFSSLHKDRKMISVGIIGYPNVGKSSIINTLRAKKTCVTAPIPGSTLVWQYVSLMKRISLIDCPGIVPPDSNATADEILLRGSVRTEKVDNPAQYIPAVFAKVKPNHLERTYGLKGWTDSHHFLELVARQMGRLLKGGEPDVDAVARIVINDFLRGRLPWFTVPPATEGADSKEIEGRAGRLGEMPKKRKRDEDETISVPATSLGAPTPPREGKASGDEEEDEFEGFGSQSEPDLSSDDEDQVGAADALAQVEAAFEDAEDVISLGGSDDEEEDSEDDADQDEEGEEEDEEASESAEEEEEEGEDEEADIEKALSALKQSREASKKSRTRRKA